MDGILFLHKDDSLLSIFVVWIQFTISSILVFLWCVFLIFLFEKCILFFMRKNKNNTIRNTISEKSNKAKPILLAKVPYDSDFTFENSLKNIKVEGEDTFRYDIISP